MKNLFTFVSIGKRYGEYAMRLINNLLEKTPYNIRVATDCPQIFAALGNSRIIIKDISASLCNNKIILANAFNYNLKFYAFEDIPPEYDSVFYLDCDQRISVWNDDEFKKYVKTKFYGGYDLLATRTDAILKFHLKNYRVDKNRDLFGHKFENYGLTVDNIPPHWLEARLPSEHFLVLKNDPVKLHVFYDTWKKLNAQTESLKDCHGTLCDAFEIGIAAAEAKYNMGSVDCGVQANVFGIVFNGNKHD
jgi:hypothetical protein